MGLAKVVSARTPIDGERCTVVDQKLERYAKLDRAPVAADGGDDFWPVPLSVAKP